MGTRLDLLDLPDLTSAGPLGADRTRMALGLPREQWLARSVIGPVVYHYEDVTAVLRDKRWHSASGMIAEFMGITDVEFLSRQRISILSAEGDMHTRLRRLVAPAFSPRAADRLRPFMREVINGLVDAVASTGRADVVADICEPYPIPIICELLGAPKQDWQLFSRWASDVLEIFSDDVVDKLDVIKRAQDELDEYSRQLIADRRRTPVEDLITDLIAAEEAGDKLDNDELVMMVEAVIVGGTDTTRNQLGCTVALMAEHPDQWVLLGQRPELAPRAVEEAMRYFGAVRSTARIASTDIDYRDVLFPAGTLLGVGLGEANYDDTVFSEPDRFDITAEPSGSVQMTFGSGIHYCLGAALARAELQEALPILASRLPELAVDGAVTWKPDGVGIFGPAHLPVVFRPT